jgi:hypothetical protein
LNVEFLISMIILKIKWVNENVEEVVVTIVKGALENHALLGISCASKLLIQITE